jgi:hypothetical protein
MIFVFWSLISGVAQAVNRSNDETASTDRFIHGCFAAFIDPFVQRIAKLEQEVAELRSASAATQSVVPNTAKLEPQDIEQLINSDLKAFIFPDKVKQRFTELNLRTVADLAKLPSSEFLVHKVLGPDVLHSISIFLSQFGLNFADLEQPRLMPEPSQHVLNTVTKVVLGNDRVLENFARQSETILVFLNMREHQINARIQSIYSVRKTSPELQKAIDAIRRTFASYGRVLMP